MSEVNSFAKSQSECLLEIDYDLHLIPEAIRYIGNEDVSGTDRYEYFIRGSQGCYL